MQESIILRPPKPFGQHMLDDPPQKLHGRLGEGVVLPSGAVFVSEGDHTVMARQNIVFTDDAPIQIAGQIG